MEKIHEEDESPEFCNEDTSSIHIAPPDPLHRRLMESPEGEIRWAVLTDAIRIYMLHACAGNRRKKILFSEAETWIWSKDLEWPFSFENICELFGLAPNKIRAGLKKWREEAISTHTVSAA